MIARTKIPKKKKNPSKTLRLKFHIEPILDNMSYEKRSEILAELSFRTGYGYQMIYRLRRAVAEKGSINIPSDKAIIIADVLGISVDQLLYTSLN